MTLLIRDMYANRNCLMRNIIVEVFSMRAYCECKTTWLQMQDMQDTWTAMMASLILTYSNVSKQIPAHCGMFEVKWNHVFSIFSRSTCLRCGMIYNCLTHFMLKTKSVLTIMVSLLNVHWKGISSLETSWSIDIDNVSYQYFRYTLINHYRTHDP